MEIHENDSQSSRANQLMRILSQSRGTFFSLSWELMTTFSSGTCTGSGDLKEASMGLLMQDCYTTKIYSAHKIWHWGVVQHVSGHH